MAPFLSSKEKDRRASVRLANVRRSDTQPLLVAEHSYARNVSDEPGEPGDPGPVSSDQDSSWRVGRRIVELDVLAKGLEGCSQCGTPLALKNTTRETRFGLGSSLHIMCTTCTCINKVPLGKKHNDVNKKQTVWDVNSKVAIGMLHIGIGETQLNNLLSVLNLPSINRNSLKKREREVGKSIEQVAKSSIRTALEREIEMTKNDTNTETDGPVHLTGSVDAAWQSRGSGRSYNSLSAEEDGEDEDDEDDEEDEDGSGDTSLNGPAEKKQKI